MKSLAREYKATRDQRNQASRDNNLVQVDALNHQLIILLDAMFDKQAEEGLTDNDVREMIEGE